MQPRLRYEFYQGQNALNEDNQKRMAQDKIMRRCRLILPLASISEIPQKQNSGIIIIVMTDYPDVQRPDYMAYQNHLHGEMKEDHC